MRNLRKFNNADEIKNWQTSNECVIPNLVLNDATKTILYNVPQILGVFIQHIDGSLYTTSDWSSNGFLQDQANGVAVITSEAKFVIAKDNASTSVKWASTSTLVDGVFSTMTKSVALTDYAGKENTAQMLTIDTSEAAYCCGNYTFPNGAKGYLPALGEWNIAYQNKAAVTEAISLIGGTALGANYYWSSTQGDKLNAWDLYWGSGAINVGGKTGGGRARPFTTLEL